MVARPLPLKEPFVAFAQFFDSPQRYVAGDIVEAETDMGLAANGRNISAHSVSMAAQSAGTAATAASAEAAAGASVRAARDNEIADEPAYMKRVVDGEKGWTAAAAGEAAKFYSDNSSPLTIKKSSGSGSGSGSGS